MLECRVMSVVSCHECRDVIVLAGRHSRMCLFDTNYCAEKERDAIELIAEGLY